MTTLLTTDAQILDLLESARTIAVVGLSERQSRPSFGVAQYLIDVGYEVVPINPHIDHWQGIQAYPSVAAIGQKVDQSLRASTFLRETCSGDM